MSNVIRQLPIFVAVVLWALPGAGKERGPTVEESLGVLVSGQGEAYEAARTHLSGVADLLKRHGPGLAAVVRQHGGDPDVLGRVFDLAAGRGEEGCGFIAGLMGAQAPAWTDLVLVRIDRVAPCAGLDAALAAMLEWSADPATSPADEARVVRVLDLVRARAIGAAAEPACRFVLAGPDGLRERALDTVASLGNDAGRACLVRAYGAESALGATPLRARLVDAIAAMGGLDAIPTLILALERPEDREAACRHLLAAGDRALGSMLFAARTADTPSPGLRACFLQTGTLGTGLVLQLVDHPAAGVREFAYGQMQAHPTEAAIALLKDRFAKPAGRLSRTTALEILASYPPEVGGGALEDALGDADEGIRMLALRLVESHRALHVAPTVLRLAEEDPLAPVRMRALQALWRLGHAEAVPLAIRMAQYEESPVAAQAVRLLGWLGGGKAFDLLLKLAKSRDGEVSAAAAEALWIQSYANPAKGKVKRQAAPKPDRPGKTRQVACGRVVAEVAGKKGPLVLVLPGGPAMDHSWARPYLDDVAGDAVLAYVRPAAEDDATGLVEPADWACLLQELGRDRATLVSSGLGGTAALWAASRDPGRVAGVVALAAPLPGATGAWDPFGIGRLAEPFQGLARGLLAERDRFHPAAFNAYLARVAAPAQADDAREPVAVLNVAFDLDRVDRAAAALAGTDVAFRPTEAGGPALLMLPLDALDKDAIDAYRALETDHPDRVAVMDLSGCGLQPQVGCDRKVVKAIVKFARALEGR